MFSDRNLINRRNVKSDIDSAVNPCRKFFELDVNARLMAAAMEILGMKSTSDTPDNTFVPVNIEQYESGEKRACLRRIAEAVVDKYIVKKEKVQALLKEVLAIEENQATLQDGKTENGRFMCVFTGCGKTFAHNGKRKRDHESTHDLPVINSDVENNPCEDVPLANFQEHECDDMYNYQCSFLEYAMIIMNFFDAIKEGDGKRVIRCWKFQLPYLKNDSGSPKYALESLNIFLQIHGLLSAQDSHSLIWNRFHCNKSGRGHNIPLDLSLEFVNRLLKEVVRKLGPNATNTNAVDRYCKAVNITKPVLDNFDRQCSITSRSGKHSHTSVITDLQKVLQELVEQQAFKWTPGRRYYHYSNCKSSILQDFNLQNMFNWIDQHKKNIVKGKKAR